MGLLWHHHHLPDTRWHANFSRFWEFFKIFPVLTGSLLASPTSFQHHAIKKNITDFSQKFLIFCHFLCLYHLPCLLYSSISVVFINVICNCPLSLQSLYFVIDCLCLYIVSSPAYTVFQMTCGRSRSCLCLFYFQRQKKAAGHFLYQTLETVVHCTGHSLYQTPALSTLNMGNHIIKL